MSETLTLRGTLKGHSDWVTSIATTPEDPNLVLSSSRDKSVLVWQLTHAGIQTIPTDTLVGLFADTLTLSVMLLLAVMDSLLFRDLGMELSVFGRSTLEKPRVVSLDTRKMFSPLPSRSTTVKSSLGPAIKLSSCGTLWESASTLLLRAKLVTLSGFLAFVSHLLHRSLSLSRAVGIVSLRSGL